MPLLFACVFCRLQISGLERLENGPRPVPNAHFGQDARNVVLYRSFRNCECISNFAVIVAARHKAENFDFTSAQAFGCLHARKIASKAIEVV